MKATRFANRAWAFVLAVLMTLTLIAPQAMAANTVDPVQPAGGKIVVSQTDYTLVDGVTESDLPEHQGRQCTDRRLYDDDRTGCEGNIQGFV